MSRKRPRSVPSSLSITSSVDADDNGELCERDVESDVRLDREVLTNLVLFNCASKIDRNDLKGRITFELVCHRCARAVRAVYDRERIALVVGRSDNDTHKYQQIFTDPLRRVYGLKRRRHEIRISEGDPYQRLRLILARFKRFRCITFHADGVKLGTRRFLEILRIHRMRPTEVARLEYRLDLTTEPDFRLIARFAPMLKALLLECVMPRTEYNAKKLWISVAKCGNLERLYFLPKNNIGYQDLFGQIVVTPIDIFSIVYLRECLRVLKIRAFHCSAASKVFHSGLADAFAGNSNLRRLFINGASNKFFSAASARPVLCRLRTLVRDYFAERKRPQDEEAELTTILQALPPTGSLTIFHLVDWHPNPWWHREDQTISNEKSTLDALQFWLKLSNQTARSIKLCLRFYRDPVPSVNDALAALSESGSALSNVILERTVTKVVLRYQQARIILSVIDARECSADSKPLTVW
uniref:Uncharacterized protein n=1 Tax=Plectus sambesii TaxID=2011161 RepID=A0A914W1V0_9BILA